MKYLLKLCAKCFSQENDQPSFSQPRRAGETIGSSHLYGMFSVRPAPSLTKKIFTYNLDQFIVFNSRESRSQRTSIDALKTLWRQKHQ